MCVDARLVCKNVKAKGKLSEERKTTEQEIQQEWKLGKSLKLNPIEEDGKANKLAPSRRDHSGSDKALRNSGWGAGGRGSRGLRNWLGETMAKLTAGQSPYGFIFHFIILLFSLFSDEETE